MASSGSSLQQGQDILGGEGGQIRIEMAADLLNQGKVGWFINCPAQMSQARRSAQLPYLEMLGVTADKVGHMFSFGLGPGFFYQQLEGRKADDFGIQAIRIAGLPAVAAVVIPPFK